MAAHPHRLLSLVSLAAALALAVSGARAQEPTATPSGNAPVDAASLKEAVDPRTRSLFFTPEEISDIRYAVTIYKKNFSGQSQEEDFNEQDFLNRLTGLRKAEETNRYYRYPQFFLESLVYHAENNWIVWINGQKITQDTPTQNAELGVIAITPDQVELKWRPLSMDKVNEVWEKNPHGHAQVFKQEGLVIFTLKPNQTFSSYVMDVLEGKVQPITVDTHNIAIDEAQPQVIDPEAMTPASADGEESRHGLTGLIGAYKRLGGDQPTQESQPVTDTPPADQQPQE